MRPNLEKVVNLFKPDANGFSEWMSIQDVRDNGLSWSDNGNVRRGVVFGVYEYRWEFKRLNNSRIIEMRTVGYNYSKAVNQSIRRDIVDELRKQTRSNFAPDCIVPLVYDDKEIDHRWGRKEHFKYEYLNDLDNQTINDFQLLSHSHNQFKREQCVKCKQTNLRFSPPNNQSFVVGCINWEDEVGCIGCPLAQPELYR